MAVVTVDVQALIAAAVESAVAVADASDAGVYLTRQQVEAAIAAARTEIQAAIDAVRVEHGLDAFPVVRKLKLLAARLLDLNRALAEDLGTVDVELLSERGVLDLALERFGLTGDNDVVARAGDILALNPQLPRPTRVDTGTTVVVHVR